MRRFIITGLAIMVMPIAFLLWTAFVSIEAAHRAAKPQESPPQKNVLKVPSNLSWKDLSDDKLQEFASFFETRNKEREIASNIQALVADGETVVTEGYESAPGEYIFSTLTPTIETLPDGSAKVRVASNTMRIGVSGEYNTLFTNTFSIAPKQSHTYFMPQGDKLHSLNVSAKPDEYSPFIKMEASGETVKW